jgi:hypothetical protein
LTQVVGYADIAEVGLELGHVSNAAIMYWESESANVIENPGKFIKDGKLWAPFVPKPLEVELDYSKLEKLLEEAKKIWKLKSPPKGRQGCPDCKKLQALFAIESEIEEELTAEDQRLITTVGYNSWTLNTINKRRADRKYDLAFALVSLQKGGDDPPFGQGGMAANWEFIGD